MVTCPKNFLNVEKNCNNFIFMICNQRVGFAVNFRQNSKSYAEFYAKICKNAKTKGGNSGFLMPKFTDLPETS